MKYSIITINYNNRDGLRKTIESVVNQSYQDFEYIVIDGGSTDGSREVIEEYAEHIDYWVSEPDKGIYNAMNKGIRVAHGDYLNFMNSGDYFYDKNVLNDTLAYLNDDIVSGRSVNEDLSARPFHVSENPTMIHFYKNTVDHQASFIARKLFKDHLYDENYKIVSDWIFYIEKIIFQNCSFSLMPVTVAIFQNGGISEVQKELNDAERRDVLSKLFPPRVIKDFEHFNDKESPMLDLIPQFNRTFRLQKVILWVTKAILYLYKPFVRKH
jgi:glycosyltransferase involved in cell wall biosynthesis